MPEWVNMHWFVHFGSAEVVLAQLGIFAYDPKLEGFLEAYVNIVESCIALIY